MTKTFSPLLSKCSATWDPTKPAPPVTKTPSSAFQTSGVATVAAVVVARVERGRRAARSCGLAGRVGEAEADVEGHLAVRTRCSEVIS